MRNKKSQITVFVILALILLIGVGLYFMLRDMTEQHQPDAPQRLVSEEVALLRSFTEDCLQRTTKEAVKLVGKQGGYTEIPAGMRINPVHPYDSDVLSTDVYDIPYWYFMRELNSFYSHKPALCDYDGDCAIVDFGENSIQRNIENYVLDNMPSCLNDFEEFDAIFEITPKADMDIRIQILEESVVSRMNYPLNVKSFNTGDETELDTYSSDLNVNLLEIFVLASEIAQAQIDYSFIEDNTLELINVYSGVDQNLLPPMAEVVFFDHDRTPWIRTEVEELLRYDVLPFVGLTRIANVYNSQPAIAHVDPPHQIFAQGFYNSFLVKLGEEKVYPYYVDLYYPDTEIDFFINGGEEVLWPTEFEGLNPKIAKMFSAVIQDYSFKYHLSFPVITRIYDPDAFNGEGFEFNIAFEANIRNNIPARGNMTLIRMSQPSRISIVDPNHLVNKTISFEVTDRRTREPLTDAQVFYSCGKEHFIGRTVLDHGRAIFEGKFPYCASGGYIKVRKDDYASEIIPFNNLEDNELPEVNVVSLWPIATKQVYFWKRTPEDVQRYLTEGHIARFSARTDLDINDTVMININRQKDHPEEDEIPLISFLTASQVNNTAEIMNVDLQKREIQNLYDSGNITYEMYDELMTTLDDFVEETPEFETPEEHYIDIIPGTYEIDGFIMTKGDFNIPAKEEPFCPTGLDALGVCIGGYEYIEYPELNLTTWITGKSLVNITIPESYVYNDKPLHFFLLYKPGPTSWDDLTDYDLEEYVEGKEYMMDVYFE